MPSENPSMPEGGEERSRIWEGLLLCPHCASVAYNGDRFCACCGGGLPRRCRMCGAAILHRDANYCTQCGAPFSPKPGLPPIGGASPKWGVGAAPDERGLPRAGDDR